MNRRAFLSFLAALPVVGKYWKPEPSLVPIQPLTSSTTVLYTIPSSPDLTYIHEWMHKNINDAIEKADATEDMRLWNDGK